MITPGAVTINVIVADLLDLRRREQGDEIALIDRQLGLHLTWAELHALANRRAAVLSTQGIRPRHRVAIMARPGAPFTAWLHACLQIGAAALPVSPRLPRPEAAAILHGCGAAALIDGDRVDTLAKPSLGDPQDACIVHTSGTTGRPKGVRLTLANQIASAMGCQESLGTGPSDRWLLTLTPAHVGGLAILFRSVICGQAVITLPGFEEAGVLATVAEDRPTLTSLVPTMVTRLVEAGGATVLRLLHAILVGGAPADPGQVRAWAAMGIPVCPTYGLTETCSQVATVPPGRAAELAETAGLAQSQARLEIVEGLIQVSGPVVSPGYVDAELPGGPDRDIFLTRDLGSLDASGVLRVTGRIDDVIITGGEKVHPEQVEAVLRRHPALEDVAVVGRPDPRWGQIIEALVVGDVDGQELTAWCRPLLPPAALPRRITPVASLPRSESGKLLRRKL